MWDARKTLHPLQQYKPECISRDQSMSLTGLSHISRAPASQHSPIPPKQKNALVCCGNRSPSDRFRSQFENKSACFMSKNQCEVHSNFWSSLIRGTSSVQHLINPHGMTAEASPFCHKVTNRVRVLKNGDRQERTCDCWHTTQSIETITQEGCHVSVHASSHAQTTAWRLTRLASSFCLVRSNALPVQSTIVWWILPDEAIQDNKETAECMYMVRNPIIQSRPARIQWQVCVSVVESVQLVTVMSDWNTPFDTWLWQSNPSTVTTTSRVPPACSKSTFPRLYAVPTHVDLGRYNCLFLPCQLWVLTHGRWSSVCSCRLFLLPLSEALVERSCRVKCN